MDNQNKYTQFDPIPKDLSNGPRKDRSCSDLFCCFMFFLFIVLSIYIAVIGLMAGNPSILAQPYDMNHQPCGINQNVDYPFIYFPSPKDLKINVCVKKCPVKDQKEVECLKNQICETGILKQDVNKGYIIYETIQVAEKVCIPLNSEYFKSVKESIDIDSFEQIASDLRNTWMICSSSILSSIILGDKSVTDHSSYKVMANIMGQFKDKNQVLAASIVFLCLAVLFILSVFCYCTKINQAVQMIKASARFITENPRIGIIPILTFIFSTIFFAYWFIVALYIYSSGGVSNKDGTLPFGHVHIGTDQKIFGWTHLFNLFWMECFFASCQEMIIAGAVCFWYFKADETEDSNTTMSFKLFFRNHIGTAAFGSFCLGILGLLRFILGLIYSAAMSLKEKGEQNSCFNYTYKSLFCFAYLFENCFRHLNKTAYVWTMLDGKNFCPSAQRGFQLFMQNPDRMFLISGIGDLFEFLGCSAICGIITMGSYFAITRLEYYEEKVENPLAPIVVIAIASYFVGKFVMSLFGTVSESLITVFIIEESMNLPNKKCPEELKDFMKSVEKR